MRTKSKLFFINGIVLTSTSIIMRFATLIFNIYITNQIGTEAVGVFSLVMAVYLFFVTISTSGLNIAVNIIVSEKFAINKEHSAIKAIRSCILFSLILGLLSGMLVVFFSKLITTIFLHSLISPIPLYCVALGLPFISMSSCISSYFTTIRKAYKNAITQIFEFVIKMVTTIILLRINISKGVEYICIALILSDVVSEICSFLLLFIFYIFDINLKKLNHIRSFGERINILKIAFPIAITSYIRSGLSTLKQLIIPKQLEQSGLSCSVSLSNYGIINGMVMPVILFSSVFINSFSMLLIPEFSTYVSQNNNNAIIFISNKILKYTSAFSFFIGSIFLIFANDLGLAIYDNLEAGFYFRILAPLVIFMYMDNVIDSILKGLNKQVGVMICNIIDLTITIGLIYFLLPIWGINGYIFSFFVSEILNFSVSLFQLIKYSKLKLKITDWILIPITCSILSYIFICILRFNFANLIINLIANILLFFGLYFSIFLLFNLFINKNIKVIKF